MPGETSAAFLLGMLLKLDPWAGVPCYLPHCKENVPGEITDLARSMPEALSKIQEASLMYFWMIKLQLLEIKFTELIRFYPEQ